MIRPDLNINSTPQALDDLTYAELVDMIEAISDPTTDDELSEVYVQTIEHTMPGAYVTDLIFWPNDWFLDEDMLDVDLASAEIAAYLMAWTDIRLPGSENIQLPEIPESKASGPPRVIRR